jgi:hypothetical protein
MDYVDFDNVETIEKRAANETLASGNNSFNMYKQVCQKQKNYSSSVLQLWFIQVVLPEHLYK